MSLVLFVLCLLSACATKLAPGGAYAPTTTNTVDGVQVVTPTSAPDTALFAIDTTFDFLYGTVQNVFKLERDNRELFKSISPKIKATLDDLRPPTKQAIVEFAKARQAYINNPTPVNLSLLDTILSKLKATGAAAEAVLPDITTILTTPKKGGASMHWSPKPEQLDAIAMLFDHPLSQRIAMSQSNR